MQQPAHLLDSSTSSDPACTSDSICKNDVFISYSRRDKAFVEKLVAYFKQIDRDPWVDWDDIHKGEDWWKSIQRGIEAADCFVFVISPDSVASSVCRDEINYAAQFNKRFLPLLWREGFDMADIHPSISQHNWIFARETDDFQQVFQELLQALDTDLDYVRGHTRLLVRSLEWQNKGYESSYLLRGIDLEDAKHWLTQGINKQPRPTESQLAYIKASLEARDAILKARQTAKRVIVLTTVIANLASVAVGLALLHWRTTTVAERKVEETMQGALRGALAGIDGDEFEALAQVKPSPGQDEPLDHPLYQQHQAWLKTVHQIVPAALPATYMMDAKGQLVVIGDVCRLLDKKTAHPYRMIIPDQEMIPARLEGFKKVSVNLTPYEDRFGKSWVSIYGPIRDRSGEVVGTLGLTYESTYWTDLEDKIRQTMAIAFAIAFVWFTVSSGLILHATQPPREILSKKH